MTATVTLLTWLVVAQPAAASPPAPGDPDRPASGASDSFTPDPGWKALGKDVWFDPQAKRVVLRARVCLNEGVLEHFLCLKGTKEHESILATEAPPQLIHAGLLLTGATTGHPVRFEPKFEPPAGTEIALEVEWEQAGQKKKADARQWVKDGTSGAALARDWVFAGSVLYQDRRTQKMAYAADDGDLITVANFASAILDLPYRSSANDADRSYVANPERVPPRGTLVTLAMSVRTPTPVAPAAK